MRPRLQQTLREGGSFGRVPIVPIVPESLSSGLPALLAPMAQPL